MVVVTDIAGRLDGLYWPQGQLEGGEMGCGIHKNGTRVGIHKKGAVGRGGGAENGIMPHKNGTTVGKLFFFQIRFFVFRRFICFYFLECFLILLEFFKIFFFKTSLQNFWEFFL